MDAENGTNVARESEAPRSERDEVVTSAERPITELEARVAKLETRDQGLMPKIKNLGIVLGVIAALATLPRTGIDFWQTFFQEGLRAQFGQLLRVQADQELDALVFLVSLTIYNDSENTLLLRGIKARWSASEHEGSSSMALTINEIACHQEGKQATFPQAPLALGSSAQNTLSCRFVLPWTKRIEGLIANKQMQMLDLEFEGEEGEPLKHKYCFDIWPDDLEWSARAGELLTFPTAACTTPRNLGGKS